MLTKAQNGADYFQMNGIYFLQSLYDDGIQVQYGEEDVAQYWEIESTAD